MSARPGYGAVVLAAGFSSRMGTLKPLLRMGSRSVLERVASNLRTAGADPIVVVTGHEREVVATEVGRLGLREAHNPEYAAGMFTSVQAGVRALGADGSAFFVQPVDYPLTASQTFAGLMSSHQEGDTDVLYPVCCERRGHPPLISQRLARALSEANPGGNLRSFLEEHAHEARDVPVDDLGVLLDMDTPADRELLDVFALAIDCWERGGSSCEPHISDDIADRLLRALQVEERVIRHSTAVAEVATAFARELNRAGSAVDERLVRSAALLHDLAKGSRRHGPYGQTLLANLGLPAIGSLVGTHMVLPGPPSTDHPPSEAELVYVADKLVVEDRLVGLDARAEYAFAAYGRDDQSRAAIEDRIQAAASIVATIERVTGYPVERILARHALTQEPSRGR